MIKFNIDIKNETFLEDNQFYKGHKNIYLILNVRNIHKLASLARDYSKWSFDLNCLNKDLCYKIINHHSDIIEVIPENVLIGVEYLYQALAILSNRLIHPSENEHIIITLVSPELTSDSMLKAFVPFSNIRKIMTFENAISDLFNEIIKHMIQKEFPILIIYPLDDIQKRQKKFRDILRIAYS